jgi:hypothetical protein
MPYADPAAKKENDRRYYLANRKAALERSRAQRLADPAKAVQGVRKWCKNNKGAAAALRAAYRARKKQAMPKWVDRGDIKFVYDIASMFGVSVDHIEPLAGKTSCGLHVPWNLQLMPQAENASKGNRPWRQ